MKPGDKVWVFLQFDERIVCRIVDKIETHTTTLTKLDKNGKERRRVIKTDVVYLTSREGLSSTPYLASVVFPTREALCEHYKKIFE